MPDSLHIENRKDDAANQLEKLNKATGDALSAIRPILDALQQASGCTDKDRLFAVECISESLNEMVYTPKSALKDEIEEASVDLDAIEWRDLRRSSPAVS